MAKAYQLNMNATRQKILKLKSLFNKSVIDFHFGEAKNFKKDISEFYLTFNMFPSQNDINFLNLNLPTSQTNMDKLLKEYLDYAYGIFVQVLGKNHSFVRNYIRALINEQNI